MRVTVFQIWRCRSTEECISSHLLSTRFQNLLRASSENSFNQTLRKEWHGKNSSTITSDSQSKTTVMQISLLMIRKLKKLNPKRKNIPSKESLKDQTLSTTNNKDFFNKDKSLPKILLMKSSKSTQLTTFKMICNNSIPISSTTPTWTPSRGCTPKTTSTTKTTSSIINSKGSTPCRTTCSLRAARTEVFKERTPRILGIDKQVLWLLRQLISPIVLLVLRIIKTIRTQLLMHSYMVVRRSSSSPRFSSKPSR